MTDQEFDILVLGGGPGGYTAAIRAAQLGFTVGLVEREEMGGVCLNWGCIPTKSLLHAADVYREIGLADQLGIEVSAPKVNLKKMIQRSRNVASKLSKGVQYLMRKNEISVIKAEASFLGKNQVQTGDLSIVADNIIIATGARAKNLPHIQVDHDRIWDARSAMTPSFMPKRLLIIGAGAIGAEFASFYATFGVEVTLVEMLNQILPVEDSEIALMAAESFQRQGIEVLTGTSVDALTHIEKHLSASINGASRNFDAAILSVGVAANTESLMLDAVGVARADSGFIEVDALCQTNIAGVYAIGDVAGAPCLAHKASHEAMIAVEAIAGHAPAPLDRLRIPGCTYSHPQVASIGLTESQAREMGDIRVGRFPLAGNGKAIAINDADGMVKTIFDKSTGALLGAHMIGPGVTELIQGFAIAIGLESTEAELIETIFPHPTLSESMHESVLAAFDRTINY
jgi:dihydrolipoamide dehydrogenase